MSKNFFLKKIPLSSLKKENLPEDFQDLAEVIGMEATIKFMEHFKGEQLYIPKKIDADRNNKILSDYKNGVYFKDLSKKYNLSYKTIIRIIGSENSAKN